MIKVFDPTKPVQARDGRKVRILCSDLNGDDGRTIVVARVESDTGKESCYNVRSNGKLLFSGQDSNYDLVNVPDRKVVTKYLKLGKTLTDKILLSSGEAVMSPHLWKLGGKMDLTFEDGELVDVAFTKKED